MIESICEKCGIGFEQSGKDNSGKRYIRRFCSRSCANSRQWSDVDRQQKRDAAQKSEKVLVANKARRVVFLTKQCPICGQSFSVRKCHQNKIYCSRLCYNKDSAGEYRKLSPGGYREGSGFSKTGWYKGFFCGSTYELVYLIWNLDSGNFIDRCDLVFEYNYNGSVHKYYPDFQTESGIVEIKGYHTDLVDVKAQAVVDAGYDIKVLYKQDLKHCFEYVSSKYGTNKFETLYEK